MVYVIGSCAVWGLGLGLLSSALVSVSNFLCKILSLVKEMTDVKRSNHLSYFRVFKTLILFT